MKNFFAKLIIGLSIVLISTIAQAATYYLYTPITGANTTFSAAVSSVWRFNVTTSFDFGGGSFTIKKGNGATDDPHFSLCTSIPAGYTGGDPCPSGPSLVATASIARSTVTSSYTLWPIRFSAPITLSAGQTYYGVLWSGTQSIGSKQYFVKGANSTFVGDSAQVPISSGYVSVNNSAPSFTISKTATPTSLATGGTITYNFGIGNSGTLDAGAYSTITIADLLPANVSYSSVTAGTGVCSSGSGSCTAPSCTLDSTAGSTTYGSYICSITLSANLPAGSATGTAAFSITATARTAGSSTNYASVDSGGGITPPAPGSTCSPSTSCASSNTVTITATAASITTSKAIATVNGSPATSATVVRPGDKLVYNINMVNNGGSSGTTTLTETVPTGTSYSGTSEGWSVSAGNYTQDVTLAAGASSTKTFTVTVSAGASADISNTVSSSFTNSCVSPNCTAINPLASQIQVTKSISKVNGVNATSSTQLKAGDVVIYNILVSNSGASGSTNLTETVPTYTTYSGTSEGWTGCTSGSVAGTQCTQSVSVGANTSVTKTFTVTLAASATLTSAGTTIDNVLLSGTAGACSDATCNTSNAIVPASLSTTKTLSSVKRGGSTISLSGYQVRSGDELTYQITVSNTGGQGGTTTITETVPTNTTYTGSGEGWSGSSPTYTQSLSVAAGASVSKTFTVTVGTLTDSVTQITNSITSSSGSCSTCTVNSATVPRLSISKTPPTFLPAGGSASWSVTITNNGGSATSGTVTFTDTLPAGLTYGSQTAGSPSLSCSAASQVVTCTGTPNIAAGSSLTVTYTTTVALNATGTKINAVLLTALGGDPRTPANNASDPGTVGTSTQGSDKLSAKSSQAIATPASLSTTKTLSAVTRSGSPVTPLSGYQVRSGDVLTYQITITNSGGAGWQHDLVGSCAKQYHLHRHW